jgi:hypothetical protein
MRRIRLVVDCGCISDPTIATLDEIARAKLEAKRAGCTLELKDPGPNLLELLDLAGLAALLLAEGEGQAEQRKELCGVEEEGELGDPPIS